MPIIPMLLSLVVPMLVKVAEKKFSGDGEGPKKHAWVLEAVDDLFDSLWPKLPEKFQSSKDECQALVEMLIKLALEKIDP